MRSASPIWTCNALPAALALAACSGGTASNDSAAPIAEAPNASAPIVNAGNAAAASNASAATVARTEPKPAPAKAKAGPKASPSAYRAIGTEPFWSVTARGSTLVLERPGMPAKNFPVSLSGKGHALRFIGEGITMAVMPGPCSDGMSDASYADRVQVTLAEGVLKGCGGERSMPEEG